ncbi:STAS domain-containing protein [Sphaerisporangium perillae]|uniref:STAS domain-containing protein n=1 Tax=Sphaerisporangium perillae TaxID=2935860 RepID=UPI002010943B|nr:STAS domain-containing protein [Sphaerisporangium perillae]
MPLKMAITSHCDPDCTVVALDGELDATTRVKARDALDALLAQGRDRIVLDVTALRFCDSGGIWLLLDVHRRVRRSGGWVRLAGAEGFLRRLLALTRLDAAFALDADVAASMAAVSAPTPRSRDDAGG